MTNPAEELKYVFRITLHTIWWDTAEKMHEVTYGVRKHVGTEESATAAAKRTRTQAGGARIERVALHNGPVFQPHEVKSFTIGLDPR